MSMEASQQFHLKWNNHSLNTLSSFQHLLDTNTLVDVSLTCCNGKTVTAHRMVLAACSEYFYRLFKELPEKHPVIVFKDASEEMVRDLLLFMYKGEVEVQESHLSDFLKFAETMQVKGLSQSDREAAGQMLHNNKELNSTGGHNVNNKSESPIKNPPVAPPNASLAAAAACGIPDMKAYLANLAAAGGKFPGLFPFPNEQNDIFNQVASPNLYRALHKYPPTGLGNKFDMAAAAAAAAQVQDNPVLKNMPSLLNLKKMFGGTDFGALGLPTAHGHSDIYNRDDNDNDSISERSPPPSNASRQVSSTPTPMDENGMDNGSSPMDNDFANISNNGNDLSSNPGSVGNSDLRGHDSDSSSTTPTIRRGGSKPSAGRGSRLERMIAAESKIINEYSDSNTKQGLPVMTPELMKSRRTHSLQLAIGEILNNKASVQSAATKYHIPRETLRRHYQRYLKAMGIQKAPSTASGGASGNSNSSTTVRSAVPTNNNQNSKTPIPMETFGEESSNGFSSLMDIGQAYGIWNSDIDGSDFKSKIRDEAVRRAAAFSAAAAHLSSKSENIGSGQQDEKEKDLVIDEEDENRTVSRSPSHHNPNDVDEDVEIEDVSIKNEDDIKKEENHQNTDNPSSSPNPLSKSSAMETMA